MQNNVLQLQPNPPIKRDGAKARRPLVLQLALKIKYEGENIMNRKFIFWLVMGMFSQAAIAGVCDYRPSKVIGGGKTAVVAGGTSAAAATGVGMNAAGLYTLVHATTGATMLGSTAAGVSAAGTTGIIAGTGGVLGSIGAVLMSPFLIIPAAATAIGVGVYEGGCYLSEKQ